MTDLFLTTIGHTRTSPVRHSFAHTSCSWLVQPGALDARGHAPDLPWWLRHSVTFRASDHLGDPGASWLDNVTAYARRHGVDLEGGTVLALTGGRLLGHVFNPLTLYWCSGAQGAPVCVIAEVHNTYGQQHAYLLVPDSRDVATVEKEFYVSPFNDVSGTYRMHLPRPTDRLDVTVTLHRPDQRPFVATWRGHRVSTARDRLQAALRLPLSTWLVSGRIRYQGIKLWRRLPVMPRPAHQPLEDL